VRILSALFLILSVTSCQTTAESNYELNRRSGLSLGQDLKDQEFNTKSNLKSKKLTLNQTSGVAANAPRLTAPSVEKVWVNSQQISEDTWIQGTWVYLQTDKPRWVLPLKKGRGK